MYLSRDESWRRTQRTSMELRNLDLGICSILMLYYNRPNLVDRNQRWWWLVPVLGIPILDYLISLMILIQIRDCDCDRDRFRYRYRSLCNYPLRILDSKSSQVQHLRDCCCCCYWHLRLRFRYHHLNSNVDDVGVVVEVDHPSEVMLMGYSVPMTTQGMM